MNNLPEKRKRKQTAALDAMIYGKVPPQAREIEEAVLGAIMVEGIMRTVDFNPFDLVAEVLKPEAFYLDSHRRIFTAMKSLANKSQPIDLLSVIEELRTREELDTVGGPFFVTRLTNLVASAANLKHHSKIIFQKYIQREIIRIGGQMVSEAYEDSSDPFELLDEVEQDVLSISTSLQRRSHEPIDNLLVRFHQEVERRRSTKQELIGVTSGYRSIDRFTHGWQPTDLIILAARPSVGKTAFALNLARNAAMNILKPTPVAFFSLEMSAGQLINRLVSSETEIALDKIIRGDLEEQEMKQIYAKGIQPLSNCPLYIDDTPALNIFELRAKCRRLKNEYSIGLIIVDYLQLMSGLGSDRSREQEISNISRSLKALAKELTVPIIALSQLSREPDKRQGSNKMPQLSDLRESGAIEQDADMVMFLYRPEYYGVGMNEMGDTNAGETICRIAKNRNGSLGPVNFEACLWIQKFVEKGDFDWTSPIYKGGGLDFKKLQSEGRDNGVVSPGLKFQLEEKDEEDPF